MLDVKHDYWKEKGFGEEGKGPASCSCQVNTNRAKQEALREKKVEERKEKEEEERKKEEVEKRKKGEEERRRGARTRRKRSRSSVRQ